MALGFTKFTNGLTLVPQSTVSPAIAGDVRYNSGTNKLEVFNTIVDPLVNETLAATLANKTLSIAGGSPNIISAASPSLVAIFNGSSQLAESSTTTTELGYLSGVTSSIQTQLGGKANTSLNNLAGTAVNTDIVPGTSGSVSLGNPSHYYLAAYLHQILSDAGILVQTSSGTSFDVVTNLSRLSQDGFNFVSQQYIDSEVLAASTTTSPTSLQFISSNFGGVEISYSMIQASTGARRQGKAFIACTGTSVSVADTFAETSDVGIIISCTISSGIITVTFTNASANATTLRSSVTSFRA